MPQFKGNPNEPSPSGAPGQLESWKEIATYLKRAVRTIQRWEKAEGLPVYRHIHDKRGSVYAFRAELDSWWAQGRARLEQEERQDHSRSRWMMVAGTAILLLLAGLGAWRWVGRSPALPFAERSWVLVTDFENRTGEPVFDGTMERFLERELSNSRFVNVAPRERLHDTLLLMKHPADAPIDAAIGREICLRDGGLQAMVTGRVEKLDSTYLLAASVVNPASGATVASFTEEASGQLEVVAAVRRLSDSIRQALGEQQGQVRESERQLARVTTPSLRALQLYTQADAVIGRSRQSNAVAEQLLRDAIAEDAGFASAYIHLAFALRNQRTPPAEYQSVAQRAWELADTTSERERYFITAAYHSMMENHAKAATAYESLLRLYPDHLWATGNLALTYNWLGRPEEARKYAVRLAELRPKDFVSNVRAAQGLIAGGNLTAADRYVEKAQALVRGLDDSSWDELAWLKVYPAYRLWLDGRTEDALLELRRVVDASQRTEYSLRIAAARAYVALGKIQAARQLVESLNPDPANTAELWVYAWLQGESRPVSDLAGLRVAGHVFTMLLARSQRLQEAQAMATREKPSMPPPPPVNAALTKAAMGEMELARGHLPEAAALLEQAMGELKRWGASTEFFLAAEALAASWERVGEAERGLQVLTLASNERHRLYYYRDGMRAAAYWMRVEAQRARLLRRLGRHDEAATAERELKKLLAHADTDHFILRQLVQAGQATSAGVESPHPD